jgi:capsular exopolysaccharide synthesis family protein
LLLAVVTAAGVWFFLPLPKLTGVLVYTISSQPPALLTPLNENKVEFATFKSMQAGKIKQRIVLNAALNDKVLKNITALSREPDPLAYLEQKVQVDFRLAPELMRVTFEGNDEGEITKILQAINDAYLAEVERMENDARERRKRNLESRKDEYDNQLAGHQIELTKYAEDLKTASPLLLAHIEDLTRNRLQQLQLDVDRNAHDKELALQDKKAAQWRIDLANFDVVFGSLIRLIPVKLADVTDAQIDKALRADDGVISRERAIALKELHLGELNEQIKDKSHPRLAAAKTELLEAQVDLDLYRADRRPKIAELLRQRIAEENSIAIARADERLANFSRIENSLFTELGNIQKNLSVQSRTYLSLEKTKQDISRKQKLLDQVVHEIDQINLERDTPSRVHKSEGPYVTTGLEGNRRLKTAMMSAGGVLLVGLIGLVFWESRNPRVLAVDDVAKALGLRVFGTVPPLTSDAKLCPAREAALTEAIDTARTMLLYDNRTGRQPKSVLVTSALPGEGKTSLASHLADSLTRAGFRTLFIDADLRNPCAHTLYQVADAPGLCESLRGEIAGLSAVQKTAHPGLDVLSAGHWTMDATQALASERWAAIRALAEASYDYVIIDSSPILPVVDTLLLARNVDGVLLSVMNQITRLENVAESQQRLLCIGANIMGVVLNGIQPKGSRYGYVPANPPRSDGEVAISA